MDFNEQATKYRHPVDYLKVFFRRKWLFVPPIFLGLVISIVMCFVLPPTYESSTVILVEEEKIINPLIQDLAVSTSVLQRMQTLKEQILSWTSLVELTKKLDLAKDAQTQLQFENLIKGLRKNILVNMRGPNLIRLSYFGKNPQETQLITKTLTDIFIEENMRSQTKETDVAINFIKDQLQLYKRKIKESEIASMEEQLTKLLADSTEQHPVVKELRQKINAAVKELDSGEYKVSEFLQPKASPVLQALQKEIEKLAQPEPATGVASIDQNAYAQNNNDSSDSNVNIYRLLLMDKLDSVLARDMKVNDNIYNMLLQKLETAKITQRLEASKEGTRYTILDPPRLPLEPSKPNKVLVLFLGLFLGAVSGTGLVFGKEFMDNSVLDIEDAKQSFELPVLGAISRLTTQEELDKEKYGKKKLVVISLTSAAVLIFIVMLVSFFKR